MAIERVPKNPIPRTYVPENSHPYRVKDGDSWISIARANHLDPWELIYANFLTHNPDEVNWYLNHYVGCKLETRDRKNWRFSSAASPGIIHIPLAVSRPVPDRVCRTEEELVCEGEELPPPAKQPPQKEWRSLQFWLETKQLGLLFGKSIKGFLAAKSSESNDWYGWRTGFAGISKGVDPRFVGDLRTWPSKPIFYDPNLFDVRTALPNKRVYLRSYLNTIVIRVVDALARKPDEHYQPIRNYWDRDLIFELKPEDADLAVSVVAGRLQKTEVFRNKGSIDSWSDVA